MSHGVISGFSEVAHWQIPDFFSVQKPYIDSPSFSLAGCCWKLRIYPTGLASRGYLSAYLSKKDPEIPVKTVAYAIGLKRADSIVEEKGCNTNRTYDQDEIWWGWSNFLNLNDLQKRKSQLAPSDTLTITCRVEREKPTSEEVAPKPKEVGILLVELEDLSSDFKELLTSERKCDVTVSVRGKEFRAHRAVLSARSPVFRAMYEHDTTEEKTGVLTIPDCDPDSFGEFLNFIYTGRTEILSFQTAYHLYATADKYDVQKLKSACADYLKQFLTAENVCDAMILADKYFDDEVTTSVQDFFNKNSLSIFRTSEWADMMRNNHRLANKLLIEMASAKSKSS